MAAEPPSLHRFAYAQLRPTVLTDPLGLCIGMACADLIDHRQEFAAAKERSRERLAEACGQDPTSPVCFGPLGQALVRTFGDQQSALLVQDTPSPSSGSYVTVVNGVQNTEADARERLARISEMFGRRVEAVWNPTAGKAPLGLLRDYIQLLAVDQNSLIDRSTAELFHQLRARIATLPPGEIHLAVAHSQGAAKLASATRLLRPEQRDQLKVITFGEATNHYPSGLAGLERYLNPTDALPLMVGAPLVASNRILLPMELPDHQFWSFLDAYERHVVRNEQGSSAMQTKREETSQ